MRNRQGEANNMHPIIEARDLSKDYGQFGALHGLNLQVHEGSVFALLGASGAGKTTAIKILLNLIRPTRGSATVCGADSRAIGPEVLAQIGYVSEIRFCRPGCASMNSSATCAVFMRRGIGIWKRNFAANSACPRDAGSALCRTACG